MQELQQLFPNLYLGFSVALSLQNLTYCFIGVFAGTMIGVLPGIGPLATIAMLLPITYALTPTAERYPARLVSSSGFFTSGPFASECTRMSKCFSPKSATICSPCSTGC